MSNGSIKSRSTSNDSLNPEINYIDNAKIQVKLHGCCLKHEKLIFTHKKVVNILIVYQINLWPFTIGKGFALGHSLFGAVTLTKNDNNFDKYKCWLWCWI